ncbi:MAG: Lrp/AsnC family transcriptional regulator [Victivallaceae bacterium]|nr:Lrp/AsnC family transcriptional regulator [Victivallaceae bacterium]
MIDETDRKILHFLQCDARITCVEIAQRLNMAQSAVLRRIRKLEDAKIIEAYETRINAAEAGLDMTTFIMVYSDEALGELTAGEKIALLPEVMEVHFMAANFCYLVKAKVANTQQHTALIKKLGKIKWVRDSQTLLVLQTIKETMQINI